MASQSNLKKIGRFVLVIGCLLYSILFAIYSIGQPMSTKQVAPVIFGILFIVAITTLIVSIPLLHFLGKEKLAKIVYSILAVSIFTALAINRLDNVRLLTGRDSGIFVTGILFNMLSGMLGVAIVVFLVLYFVFKKTNLLKIINILMLVFVGLSLLTGLTLTIGYNVEEYPWYVGFRCACECFVLPIILYSGFAYYYTLANVEELPKLQIGKNLVMPIVIMAVVLGSSWVTASSMGFSVFRGHPYGAKAAEEKYSPVSVTSNSNLYYSNVTGYQVDDQIVNVETIGTLTTFETYRLRDKGDITYVNLEEAYEKIYMLTLYGSNYEGYFNLELVENEDSTYTLRNKVSRMVIDVWDETIRVADTSGFMYTELRDSDGVYLLVNGGETSICQTTSATTTIRERDMDIVFDFSKYSIDLLAFDKVIYVPLQSFIDIFIAPNLCSMAFNGKDLYLTDNFQRLGMQASEGSLEYQFYNDSPWSKVVDREKQFADFTYNEMCFALDYFYGLGDHRKILPMDKWIFSLGLKRGLKSTNGVEYEKAFMCFIEQYLAEGHTAYSQTSPFAVKTDLKDWEKQVHDANYRVKKLDDDLFGEMRNSRKRAGKDVGLSTYMDTAIISFDGFNKASDTSSLYKNVANYSYSDLHDYDSYLFFLKAFNEIKKDSKIRNVVIDLTLNGGGAVNAIPFLLAFITEDPLLPVADYLTGEISEAHYSVDLNQDGTFGDTYKNDYKFYLMTSNGSFSCGNSFPSIVKSYHMATLFGETSGGGACCVGRLTTASGSMANVSSTKMMGKIEGKEFTFFEEGIQPDYSFSRENFYNDEAIYDFLRRLG